MHVQIDTLHRVAAAFLRSLRSVAFGRRLTAAAVFMSPFVLIAQLQREMTCLTDPVRAAVAEGMLGLLTARLLLLMLLPGPRRVHLASFVNVVVAVGERLMLIVGGVNASIDAPPEAWH